MPIGAVWIPFRSRPFYNRLANRLAIRVCLDEETLVAFLNNFDADWLLRHPRERNRPIFCSYSAFKFPSIRNVQSLAELKLPMSQL